MLDDTNRKPICRLYLNDAKFTGLVDDKKDETKHPPIRLDDIFQHADLLSATVKQYEHNM